MTVAKKTVAKKPAPKKSAAEIIEPKQPVKSDEARVLYTIRLEPSIIAKLNDMAKKLGTTHASVARSILREGV